MSLDAHSIPGHEEGNSMLGDVRTYLMQMIETVEDAIILGSGLDSVSELVLYFQEMYKVLRNLGTENSPAEVALKKKILSDILHSSIELSIAHDLLAEEGKKTPQFYHHFTACLEDLKQSVAYAEEKAVPLRSRHARHGLLEEKISSNNFVQALNSFADDILSWQEDLYVEYRYLENGAENFDREEKIVNILHEMFLSLPKLCMYMNRTNAHIEGELDRYYRLRIVLCYQQQQVEKLRNYIEKFQLMDVTSTRQVYKVLRQLRQGLEDILSVNKSIPEIINAWTCTKTTWRPKNLSAKNQHLRLIAP